MLISCTQLCGIVRPKVVYTCMIAMWWLMNYFHYFIFMKLQLRYIAYHYLFDAILYIYASIIILYMNSIFIQYLCIIHLLQEASTLTLGPMLMLIKAFSSLLPTTIFDDEGPLVAPLLIWLPWKCFMNGAAKIEAWIIISCWFLQYCYPGRNSTTR